MLANVPVSSFVGGDGIPSLKILFSHAPFLGGLATASDGSTPSVKFVDNGFDSHDGAAENRTRCPNKG